MAQGQEEQRAVFTKFWQAVQLREALGPTEAAAKAIEWMKSGEPPPDFFTGASAPSLQSLDLASAESLEQAVSSFRDPFLLNTAFPLEQAQPMEVDSETAPPGGHIPAVDLPALKAWYEKVAQARPPPLDPEGDVGMSEPPGYLERLLEACGDLCSALARKLVKPRRSGGSWTGEPFGCPEILPSFLDYPQGLRFLVLILFHPSLGDPDSYGQWHRVLRGFRILSAAQRDTLAAWFADEGNVSLEEFQEILQNLQQLITIEFLNELSSSDMPPDAQARADHIPEQVWSYFVARTAQKCKNALCCIDVLWKANLRKREARRRWRIAEFTRGTAAVVGEEGRGLPPRCLKDEEFFNDALNSCERVLAHEFDHSMLFEHMEAERDMTLTARPRRATSLLEIERKAVLNNDTFGLLAHPFCLDASNKCRFLMFDSSTRQRDETRQEVMAQVMQGLRRVNPYLVIRVKREDIVQDTLQSIGRLRPSEFRKKLKIQFEGEAGVDEGGVKKEFFELLVEKLYDPNYAMFNYNSNNKTYWFNPGSFESNLQYEMFGALLGMAIYNQVILSIRFPPVVYEKLLVDDPAGFIPGTLDTLMDIEPVLAKSLREMLEFDGNVEEVFCRSFVASYENFGAVVEVPLKEGGDLIPVTNANRREYVDLYVNWFFNESIHEKFSSFKLGFLRCMEVEEDAPAPAPGAPAGAGGTKVKSVNMFLKLFRPVDLELLVCGNPVLDFQEYRNNTDYTDGYDASSDQCRWFWEIVLDSFDEDQRRELLTFVTGSDRAPPKGLGAPEARLTISRPGPDCESLPTAHTCFNHLLIPPYPSKEKLEAKLRLAITFNQGFGIA